jgi:hypothetical protein
MKSTDIKINISVPDDMDFDSPTAAHKIKITLSHDDCGDKELDEFADGFGHLLYNIIQEFGRQAKEVASDDGRESDKDKEDGR